MEQTMFERYAIDSFSVGSFMDIFVTKSMSARELENEWKKIRDEIAKKYQRELTDDFERWNFYLFYVLKTGEKIDENLKFKIEHNTLSSRKIIISEEKIKGKKQPEDLIVNYLCYSLNLGAETDEKELFEKNNDVVNLLK